MTFLAPVFHAFGKKHERTFFTREITMIAMGDNGLCSACEFLGPAHKDTAWRGKNWQGHCTSVKAARPCIVGCSFGWGLWFCPQQWRKRTDADNDDDRSATQLGCSACQSTRPKMIYSTVDTHNTPLTSSVLNKIKRSEMNFQAQKAAVAIYLTWQQQKPCPPLNRCGGGIQDFDQRAQMRKS